MADELATASKVTPLHSRTPQVGQYYWYAKTDDDEQELRFAREIGSNYVCLINEVGTYCRVHFRDFWTQCKWAEAPEAEISRMALEATEEARGTQLQIQETIQELLPQSHGPSAALVPASAVDRADDYVKRLAEAKGTVLPALYRKLKEQMEYVVDLEKFRNASLLYSVGDQYALQERLQHQVEQMSLYAGIKEQTTQVRDGRAALTTEPLHLMQRMHYMDEESLIAALEGGMRANSLSKFDTWLAREENFRRVFPHPRCAVAFRVRREAFENNNDLMTMRDFLVEIRRGEADKETYLYFRNGEQLWRVNTTISFEAQVFSDERDPIFTSTQLWYDKSRWYRSKRIDDAGVVTEARLAEMRDEDRAAAKKYKKDRASFERLRADCIANGGTERDLRAAARDAGISITWDLFDRDEDDDRHNLAVVKPEIRSSKYKLVSPETTDFDDIMSALQSELQKRNRFMLLLQGVFDRSLVLHPHAKINLADPEQFEDAVRLVYDDSRAVASGDPPDYDAYVDELRAAQRRLPGPHVFYGQRQAWEDQVLQKESDRHGDRASFYRATYGNPGPDLVMVGELGRTYATFRWVREALSWRAENREIPCSIRVPVAQLFPVDVYTPGEWRRFYDDPRTRAQYQKWAPALLSAEIYHRGDVPDVDV